ETALRAGKKLPFWPVKPEPLPEPTPPGDSESEEKQALRLVEAGGIEPPSESHYRRITGRQRVLRRGEKHRTVSPYYSSSATGCHLFLAQNRNIFWERRRQRSLGGPLLFARSYPPPPFDPCRFSKAVCANSLV